MTATTQGSATDWMVERRWLGYAGLVPFAAGCAFLLAPVDPAWQGLATETLRHHAAVIASFLGAVHWGMTARPVDRWTRARLRWGVTPALLAWLLLSIDQPAPALAGFAVLFAFVLIVDRYLLPALDDAYRGLRLRLTLAVITLLLVAAAATSAGAGGG